MPFNPTTYRLEIRTDLLEILDTAVERGSVFVPCKTTQEARGLILKLGRYRSAHEIQAKDWESAGTDLIYKYAWLRFTTRTYNNMVGVLITSEEPVSYDMYDPNTMEKI